MADTKISFIDGERGILIYRAYRIEELAERSSFMETAYLLLNDTLPDSRELEAFTGRIAAARQIPDFILNNLKTWPRDAHPMDVLQDCVPMLGMADPELRLETREASRNQAIRLIARLPVE